MLALPIKELRRKMVFRRSPWFDVVCKTLAYRATFRRRRRAASSRPMTPTTPSDAGSGTTFTVMDGNAVIASLVPLKIRLL